ncbi:hypothetical protein CCP3SC1AL1_320002 [Gammaproteobacteria bacterium]
MVVRYLADINDLKSKVADIGQLNTSIAKSAKETSVQITSLAGSVSNLGGVLQNSVGLLASIGLLRLSKEIAETAGRAETLQKVMYIAGKNAGYSRDALDGYEKSLKKLGIATKEARESISKMMQANIDLAKSSALARAAQDLAVVAGWNSSETFQRLIVNIQQADTMGLRFMGIIVDQAEAQRLYAKETNVVGRELTKQEKTQATLQAVLRESAKVNGAYEESMTSWFKVMGTTERYVQELKIALGKGLQGTLYEVEIAMQKSMDALTHLDSETLKSLGSFVQLSAVVGSAAAAVNILSTVVGTSRSGLFAIVGLITALSATKFGEDLTESVVGLGKALPSVITDLSKMADGMGNFKDVTVLSVSAVITLASKLNPIVKVLLLAIEVAGILRSLQNVKVEPEMEKEIDKASGKDLERMKLSSNDKDKEAIDKKIKDLREYEKQLREEYKKIGYLQSTPLQLIGKSVVRAGSDDDKLSQKMHKENQKDLQEELNKYGFSDPKQLEAALGSRINEISKIRKEATDRVSKMDEDEVRKSKEKREQDEAKFLMQSYGVNNKFAEIEKLKTEEDQKKALEDYKKFWEDKIAIEGEGMNKFLKDEGFAVDISVVTKSIGQKLVALTGDWEEVGKSIDSATKESSLRKLQLINKELGVIETRISKSPKAGQVGFDPLLEDVYNKKLLERKKIIEDIGKNMTEGSSEYMKGFSTAYSTYLDKIIKKLGDVHDKHMKLLDESSGLTEKESDMKNQMAYANNLPAGSDSQKSLLESLTKAKSELSEQRRDIDTRLRELQGSSNRLSQQLENAMQERLSATETFYASYLRKIKEIYGTEAGLTEEGNQKKIALERDMQQTKLGIYEDTQKKIEQLLDSEIKNRDSLLDKIRSVQNEISKSYMDVAQKAKTASDAVFGAMQQTDKKKYTTSDISDKSIDIRRKMGQGDLTGAKEDVEGAKKIISSMSANTFGLKSSVEDIAKLASEIEKAMQQKDVENKKVQLEQLGASLKQTTADIEALKTKALEISQTINSTKFDLQLEPAKKDLQEIKTVWDAIQSKTVTLTIERSDTGTTGYKFGGPIIDFIRAQQGRHFPGYGGGDKIPILGEAGEYMHRKEAVRHYGLKFMDDLNHLRVPKSLLVPAVRGTQSAYSNISTDNRKSDNRKFYVTVNGAPVNVSKGAQVNLSDMALEIVRDRRRRG